MLRKFNVLLLISCLFVSAGVVSCNKDEKQPTVSSRMVGKWKKVRFATDDNANNVLDDWEIRNADPDIVNKLEFKSDNTGIEYTTSSPDLPFTWSLNAELTMTFTYRNSDPIMYKITRINTGKLEMTTKTKNGLVGYYYERN